MKHLLRFLLVLCVPTAIHAQYIVLAGNTFSKVHPGTYSGSVNTNPAATTVSGGTPAFTAINLTPAQVTALNTLTSQNPKAQQFAFDGTTFTVATIEQLRLGLLSIYNGLTAAEQALFAPQFQAAAARLAKGDVAGVQLIVTLSGTGMPQDIATARTAMLALIVQLYPGTLPAVN